MNAGSLALASVAVVISLVNLLLILAIVRRMRRMGPMIPAEYMEVESGPPPGSVLPDFNARTTSGAEAHGSAFATRRGLVAFLSVGCSACSEQIPLLSRYVARERLDPDHALIVVSGDPDGRSAYAQMAASFAHVVAEESNGPLTRTFDIKAFPTVLALHDGRVQANAPSVSALHLETARTRPGS